MERNTRALALAIAQAHMDGRTVELDAGEYILDEPLVITWDVTLRGAGFGETGTVLVNQTGKDYPIIFIPPKAGIKAHLSNFRLRGGGIHAMGAVQSTFNNIWITEAPAAGLWLYHIQDGVMGHHNRVVNCTFDQSNLGVLVQASDENWVSQCDFETCQTGIKDWAGNNQILGNVFVHSQTGILMQDNGGSMIALNNFDGVAVPLDDRGSGGNIILGNKGLG